MTLGGQDEAFGLEMEEKRHPHLQEEEMIAPDSLIRYLRPAGYSVKGDVTSRQLCEMRK